MEKLKEEKIDKIVQVVEEKYIESNNDKDSLPDFQEIVLREKLKNTSDISSVDYKRTLQLLRVIIKNKKKRDVSFKKIKKRVAPKINPKPVTPIKSKHKKTNQSNQSKKMKTNIQKTKQSEIKIKNKILSNNQMVYNERDCVEVENIFNKLLFRFLIFRNFNIDFFDINQKRLFSIFFRKNFTIAICKYKEEIQKRKVGNIFIKKEIVSDYTIINNKFKLWSVAWNGLLNINKNDFIENMEIEDNDAYYNIILPNNTSFKYEKNGRKICYFRPTGKIISKYI